MNSISVDHVILLTWRIYHDATHKRHLLIIFQINNTISDVIILTGYIIFIDILYSYCDIISVSVCWTSVTRYSY